MTIQRGQIYFVNLNPVSPEESGLPIETVFLCCQIRSLDKTRFTDQPSGQLSENKMLEIEAAVRYCLGL